MARFKQIIDRWNEYLEFIDTEFRNAVSKYDTNNSIKIFPKNANEKEILAHLAKKYHIKRELENNKFPLSDKHGLKNLIRELYRYASNFTPKEAYPFIAVYIETGLEGCNVQNYCREIKKDMPTL
ncbi:MAG: hypothetical protein LBH20_09325 [Treponema sp.]|nr:hypothetical protein [Treponema sp.]